MQVVNYSGARGTKNRQAESNTNIGKKNETNELISHDFHSWWYY